VPLCWTLLQQLAFGQDLFLPSGALHSRSFGSSSSSDGPSSNLTVRSSATVLTLSPILDANVCLDLDVRTNKLQVWQCNGRETQLWYFDAGTFELRWAGDGSKCIDAGQGMQQGTVLYLWGCNGHDQQKWGFDSHTGAISLIKSSTPMCMDLRGSTGDAGSAVWIWNCDQWKNQQWFIHNGITIRTNEHYTYCLDLDGGKTDAGTPVILWSCHNGLISQKWFFENYAIKSAADKTKCLDAGTGAGAGTKPMLWDCNSKPQQKWGYDATSKTIYLVGGATANAKWCLDIGGGSMARGTILQLWNCNRCWNQLWSVTGPATQFSVPGTSSSPLAVAPPTAAKKFLQSESGLSLQADCPARKVSGHCFSSASQYGWPVFHDQKSLQGSPWGTYFQEVYGEIPMDGSSYPICTYAFRMLYIAKITQLKIQTPIPLSRKYPDQTGELYDMMGFFNKELAWIWDPVLSAPWGTGTLAQATAKPLPASTWVEIMHVADKQDGTATWMYYSPGSAVWYFMGNTKYYNLHADAVKDLLNEDCKVWPGDYHDECESQFEAMYTVGISRAYDSLQFLFHDDMPGGTGTFPTIKRGNLAIEIVDLLGDGTTVCGGPTGFSRFRAGWEASHECYCDASLPVNLINCKGFGVLR
jgi:hypothetical protein